MGNKAKRVFLIVVATLAAAFIIIQLVPVDRSNPPATAPLQADADVMQVLRTSCYDCHSNETVWPWYSYVAPVSWLVAKDVREGRQHLNFSEWGNMAPSAQAHAREEAYEEAGEGEMPLPIYLPAHPEARLGSEEIAVLARWASESGTGAESGYGGGQEDEEREEHEEHEHGEHD
jgi:hypothetical protein